MPPTVAVEPLRRCLPGFLRILAPWSVVLVGRRVCLVAQHLPPAVWLVQAVRRRQERHHRAGR